MMFKLTPLLFTARKAVKPFIIKGLTAFLLFNFLLFHSFNLPANDDPIIANMQATWTDHTGFYGTPDALCRPQVRNYVQKWNEEWAIQYNDYNGYRPVIQVVSQESVAYSPNQGNIPTGNEMFCAFNYQQCSYGVCSKNIHRNTIAGSIYRTCYPGWRPSYDDNGYLTQCYIRQSDLEKNACPAGIKKDADGKCITPASPCQVNELWDGTVCKAREANCPNTAFSQNGVCVPLQKNGNCDQPD